MTPRQRRKNRLQGVQHAITQSDSKPDQPITAARSASGQGRKKAGAKKRSTRKKAAARKSK